MSKEASKLSLAFILLDNQLGVSGYTLHHLPLCALSYVESRELNSLKAFRKRLTNVCMVGGGGAQGEWLLCSVWQVKALGLLAFSSLKAPNTLWWVALSLGSTRFFNNIPRKLSIFTGKGGKTGQVCLARLHLSLCVVSSLHMNPGESRKWMVWRNFLWHVALDNDASLNWYHCISYTLILLHTWFHSFHSESQISPHPNQLATSNIQLIIFPTGLIICCCIENYPKTSELKVTNLNCIFWQSLGSGIQVWLRWTLAQGFSRGCGQELSQGCGLIWRLDWERSPTILPHKLAAASVLHRLLNWLPEVFANYRLEISFNTLPREK